MAIPGKRLQPDGEPPEHRQAKPNGEVALRKKISELLQRGPFNPNGKLLTKIAQMEVLLHEYRQRFEEETGHRLDEKEVLFG